MTPRYMQNPFDHLWGEWMNRKIKETSFYHTKIKEWPEEERPREKLLKHGPRILSDAELLALLIESGTGGVTAVDIAKRLLVENKNLTELAGKSLAELLRMKGIGPARGAKIISAFEIGRRACAQTERKRIKINSPEDVVQFILPDFRDLKREIFKSLMLDSGNKIIREVTISEGTLNASIVHPREVFKAAIDHLAAGIVILHNHPSGERMPSKEDHRITFQLIEAGQIVGIPVLDHIIIAGDTFFSFAKEGLMRKK